MSRSLSAYARRIPGTWYATTVLVLALAVSGAFGGLSAVAAPAVPTIAVNRPIPGGPWAVTIVDARIASSQTGWEADPGNRWFVVVATVDVTATTSTDVLDAVTVSGVPGLLPGAELLLVRDGSTIDYLNPGMPERVGFAWQQKADEPIPKAVAITVYGESIGVDDLAGEGSAWSDPTPIARVTATVKDERS